MSKYTKALLHITTVITLFSSATVLADDIQEALKDNRVHETVESKTHSGDARLGTDGIQRLVDEYRALVEAKSKVQTDAIVDMKKPAVSGGSGNLGNPVKI